jgi:hypothetical protein
MTGSLIFPRYFHTMTLLPNGKVLVAGGYDGNSHTSIASAELYDPATETWRATGSLNTPRESHTATLLPNGKVLVAAGDAAGNSAELYDPATGTWTPTGSLNTARIAHNATLLPGGKVLVAGGTADGWNSLSGAELYDPVTGTWTQTGALNSGRWLNTMTSLPNGKVLVASGFDGNSDISNAELYDPSTGAWTTTGSLNVGRTSHAATLLPNGKVLVTGGNDSAGSLASTELYDAGLGYTNAWQPQITAITAPLSLGNSLVVTGSQFRGVSGGSGGNSQDSSTDYPLVQLRSIESGQTVFLLTTNWSTNSFTSLPVWNFPPGYALATVFVNGIQSTSSIVNISVPLPTAPKLSSATMRTDGSFQFAFTNSVGALFGVLATTNLALPLTNWTALGGVVEIAPGQFQFSDLQATNGPKRFYRAFAP